ncbi:MAG TPA: hypothetical protein VK948_02425, partial [Aeromicrobium sp.]|nr:hypothetical protein [Aeromicrobium sp.]
MTFGTIGSVAGRAGRVTGRAARVAFVHALRLAADQATPDVPIPAPTKAVDLPGRGTTHVLDLPGPTPD